MQPDLKPFVGRRVLVFTDLTFDGTLDRVGRDSIQLANASVVADDGSQRPVDGTVVIPMMKVDWVQVP